MAKIGRPKKDVVRNNQVMVRFTDDEYKKLKECTQKSNLTMAEILRQGIKDIINS